MNNDLEYRQWLVDLLHDHVLTVTFRKADSSTRVMRATLRKDMLPAAPVTEERKPRRENASVLAVYDVENSGWRSFRLDSIIEVKINLGTQVVSE